MACNIHAKNACLVDSYWYSSTKHVVLYILRTLPYTRLSALTNQWQHAAHWNAGSDWA